MSSTRELNRQERNQLQSLSETIATNSKSNFRVFIVITLIIAAFCLFIYIKEKSTVTSIGVFGVYSMIALWVYLEVYVKNSKRQKSLEQTLRNNSINITKVKSTRFIQLDQEDDEGYYYLFELVDKRTISIGGQDFDPSIKFPNDNFEIAIARNAKNEINLFERYDKGNKIKPEKRIDKLEKWKLLEKMNYPNPEEFEIVDVSLDEIEAYIKSGK